MFSIVSTLVLLALPLGGTVHFSKRAPLRPLFGAATSWGAAQSKQQVMVAKKFCGRLRGRLVPPTTRELKASPPIPEWSMLRWRMNVSHVRAALGRVGWPVRIHCLAKTGSPYLKLRRVLHPGVPGARRGPWDVTLYFKWAAPAGLVGVLVTREMAFDSRNQRRFERAVLSAYGSPAKRIHRVSRREIYKEFVWIFPGTKIRLMMRRNRKSGKFYIWFRYVPGK